MNLNKPIENDSVVNIVLRRIKDALVEGELHPGDKLPSEEKLSKKMNVGRSTVREAIKMLEALGVVEIRRGDGTYIVESMDARSINPLIFSLILQTGNSKGLVELRYMVESGFMKLAIDKLTETDLNKVKKALDKHKEAVENENYQNLGELDMKFHYTILEIIRNPFISELSQTVLELFRASISRTTKMVPERAVRDHETLYKALKSRDKNKVEKAVQESFEIWKDHIRENNS